MSISARNQIEGKVLEVTLGDIMAHVVVKVGKNQIESVITRKSAKQLNLKKGDKVTVIIKVDRGNARQEIAVTMMRR